MYYLNVTYMWMHICIGIYTYIYVCVKKYFVTFLGADLYMGNVFYALLHNGLLRFEMYL